MVVKIHSPLRAAWFKLMSARVDMGFSLSSMWNHVLGRTPLPLAKLDAHNRKVGAVGVAFVTWLCTDSCEKYAAEQLESMKKAEKQAEKLAVWAARKAEQRKQRRRLNRQKARESKTA